MLQYTMIRLAILLVCFALTTNAQDLGWLIEQSPSISAGLTKLLVKVPSFSAKVDVRVVAKADPSNSSASGTVDFKDGNLRWEARLSNITSTQLTPQARSVVRQINGEQFLLLTRPDQGTNYLILAGVQACLAEALPRIKLLPAKGSWPQEVIDGHSCQKQRFLMSQEGRTNELFVWKAKDLKNVPLRVQLTENDQEFRIELKEVRFRALGPERFELPSGLTQYHSMEDLVQSVLIAKMKRRMGLE